jgi:hypothetical protein
MVPLTFLLTCFDTSVGIAMPDQHAEKQSPGHPGDCDCDGDLSDHWPL